MAAVLVSTLTVKGQKIDHQELKVDVAQLSNSFHQLRNLEPIAFNYNVQKYKHLNLPAGQQYGFAVSSFKNEFPHLIFENAKFYNVGKNDTRVAKYDDVKSEQLIPLLVSAVKEQQVQIEQLKKELVELKKSR